MKKDKKENIREDSGPQKIEVKFKLGKLFFGVNGSEYYLDKEAVASLLTREVLLALEKTEEKEIFDEFQTIENLAKFCFFSGRGMTPRKIADVLNFDEGKYIKWLNMNSKDITSLISANGLVIEKRIEELEKEYPLPKAKEEGEFWPDAAGKIGKKVAEMLLEDKNPRIIAQELGVDYAKFSKWFLNKDTQRNIMRIRNE